VLGGLGERNKAQNASKTTTAKPINVRPNIL
jgi:hypothetical protein